MFKVFLFFFEYCLLASAKVRISPEKKKTAKANLHLPIFESGVGELD